MKTSKLNYLLNQGYKIDEFTRNFNSPSYWCNGHLLLSKQFFPEEIEYLINMAKAKKIKIVEKTDEEMNACYDLFEEVKFHETNLSVNYNKKRNLLFLSDNTIFAYNEQYLDALESMNQIHYEVLNDGSSKYLLTNSDRSFVLMNVKTDLHYKITEVS